MIIADAKKSAENLERHLYWTLFIKHFSSRYRLDEGRDRCLAQDLHCVG